MTEIKKLNVSIRKNGNGYQSSSIFLPKKWLDQMNVTKEEREVKVSFDGNKIIIEKI